jgi:beta-lactamase regulating signal transducer with metallopeptidase domain
VLDLHDRKGVIEVKVIEVGHAFVGLHARTVLLVSRGALARLTAEELQAVAAHELAHEYSGDDYQVAIRDNAWERRQEMELMCDGFTVMTLRVLRVDPARLMSAVTRLTRHNEEVGATATAGAYVPLADRRRFIGTVAGLIDATDRAAGAPQTASDERLCR